METTPVTVISGEALPVEIRRRAASCTIAFCQELGPDDKKCDDEIRLMDGGICPVIKSK